MVINLKGWRGVLGRFRILPPSPAWLPIQLAKVSKNVLKKPQAPNRLIGRIEAGTPVPLVVCQAGVPFSWVGMERAIPFLFSLALRENPQSVVAPGFVAAFAVSFPRRPRSRNIAPA